MDLHTLLIVAAVILFLLDGFRIPTGLNCTALGFACLAATLVMPTNGSQLLGGVNAVTVIAIALGILLVVVVVNALRTRRPRPA